MTHALFSSGGIRGVAAPRRRLARQRGVSLIIAMVMLVVIGFMSVAIMRRATSSDQVAMNNRQQTQANLYAQSALQFCEAQIIKPGGPVAIQAYDATGAHWLAPANWLGNLKGVYRLQAADLPSGNTPAVFPQCIVEISKTDPKLYVVTARGYSDDFTADGTTGSTKTGSVVWLQSQVLAY